MYHLQNIVPNSNPNTNTETNMLYMVMQQVFLEGINFLGANASKHKH